MRNILSHFSTDAEAYISALTPMTLPAQVMVDGRFLTHDGIRGQQLHPYVAVLYHEGYATMGMIALRGGGKFIGTSSFHKHFFTEHEADRVWREEVRKGRRLDLPSSVKSMCLVGDGDLERCMLLHALSQEILPPVILGSVLAPEERQVGHVTGQHQLECSQR